MDVVPKVSISGAGGAGTGDMGGPVIQGLLALLMSERLDAKADEPV